MSYLLLILLNGIYLIYIFLYMCIMQSVPYLWVNARKRYFKNLFMFLFIIIIFVVIIIIIIIIIIIKYERHWSVHIKLCPILRLAKAKTMVDSNLAPWEFAPDPGVILVLLWDKVGRLSVVTIFTLPYPTLL